MDNQLNALLADAVATMLQLYNRAALQGCILHGNAAPVNQAFVALLNVGNSFKQLVDRRAREHPRGGWRCRPVIVLLLFTK